MVEVQVNEEAVDRLSGMPDLVLAKIKSFLPTKNAVGTIILSKRWKLLFQVWVPPIKIDLHDYLMLPRVITATGIPHPSFVDFINKLLNKTLVDVPYLDTVSLRLFKNYDDEKIISWVKDILRLKVRDLDIWINLNDTKRLFKQLHSCETLVRLVVSINFPGKVTTFVPPNFRLPNLKILCVRGMCFEDDTGFSSINGLIGGCPVIEELTIKDCIFEHVESLRIESPLLKNITIDDCLALVLRLIDINSPSVKWFIYKKLEGEKFRVCGFKSLSMACIDARSIRGVAELVTACSSTARLCLASFSISAMQHLPMDLSNFPNLTWLELGCLGPDGWTQLPLILKSAPYLQRLTLKEGFLAVEMGHETLVPPTCLKLRLKEFDVWEFKQRKYEINLIKYFLINGEVLQKIRLHYSHVYKDLSSLRRSLVLPSDKILEWTEIKNGVQILVKRL